MTRVIINDSNLVRLNTAQKSQMILKSILDVTVISIEFVGTEI